MNLDKIKSELDPVELKNVTQLLTEFENSEFHITGMRNINGGYCEVTAYECDDEDIFFEVEWGEQDMGDGHSSKNTNTYKLERATQEVESW